MISFIFKKNKKNKEIEIKGHFKKNFDCYKLSSVVFFLKFFLKELIKNNYKIKGQFQIKKGEVKIILENNKITLSCFNALKKLSFFLKQQNKNEIETINQ